MLKAIDEDFNIISSIVFRISWPIISNQLSRYNWYQDPYPSGLINRAVNQGRRPSPHEQLLPPLYRRP